MCYWEENSAYHVLHQKCLWLLYKIGNRRSPVSCNKIPMGIAIPLLFISLLWIITSCDNRNKYINKHISKMENKNSATLFQAVWWGWIRSFHHVIKLFSAFWSTFISSLHLSQQFLKNQGRIVGCVMVQGGLKRSKLFPENLLHHQGKLLLMSMFLTP